MGAWDLYKPYLGLKSTNLSHCSFIFSRLLDVSLQLPHVLLSFQQIFLKYLQLIFLLLLKFLTDSLHNLRTLLNLNSITCYSYIVTYHWFLNLKVLLCFFKVFEEHIPKKVFEISLKRSTLSLLFMIVNLWWLIIRGRRYYILISWDLPVRALLAIRTSFNFLFTFITYLKVHISKN